MPVDDAIQLFRHAQIDCGLQMVLDETRGVGEVMAGVNRQPQQFGVPAAAAVGNHIDNKLDAFAIGLHTLQTDQ